LPPPAANLLGAQLGFTYAVSPSMVTPMLLAKIVSGVLAMPLCHLLVRHHFLEYRDGGTTDTPNLTVTGTRNFDSDDRRIYQLLNRIISNTQ
jgi:hypothetical protein